MLVEERRKLLIEKVVVTWHLNVPERWPWIQPLSPRRK
jgi:hypothetical protein